MNFPLAQNSQEIAHLSPAHQLNHVEHHLNETTANFQGVEVHIVDPQHNNLIHGHIEQAQAHYNNALHANAQNDAAFNNHIEHALLHLNHAKIMINNIHVPAPQHGLQAVLHELNNIPADGAWNDALNADIDALLNDAPEPAPPVINNHPRADAGG